MGSFLYPRTIEIRRINTGAGATDTNIGLIGYSGDALAPTTKDPAQGETVLFTAIPANIQAMQMGRKATGGGGLPTQGSQHPSWKVIIPPGAVPKDSIRDGDIIVDDQGYRYQVAQNYWNSLGYQAACMRLEA